MANIPNPKWYDEGTVALTQGSPTVTGTGTFWVSAGVQAGDIFLDADKKIYEITAVNDSTSLTLGNNYTGATGSGKGYSIIRVFNSTMNATLANRVAILLSEFEKRYDLDMQAITPKSAYDIAKDNGFTGTENEWLASLSAYGIAVRNGFTGTQSEWLESLKAAGEWSELNARTSLLTSSAPEVHNSIAGFRDKGTELTDEQKTAIKNHTWEDMYIGDSWTLNGHTYRIAKFVSDTGWRQQTPRIMMLSNQLYKAQMNETKTNEGGYVNSWLHTTGLAQAGEIIAEDFGDLIRPFYEFLPASNATGYIAAQEKLITCMIPTYYMMFGHPFAGYPQDWSSNINYQLPLTQLGVEKMQVYDNYYFWCQECFNSTDSFIVYKNTGVFYTYMREMEASQSYGVRVIFFIG